MKKFILICGLWMCVSSAQADLKDNVHSYLTNYEALIVGLYDGLFNSPERLRVGAPSNLVGNEALLHMSEVINVITSDKLDECCFRSTPDAYKNYANAKTDQVIQAAVIPNPGDPANPNFQIPTYLGTQMKELVQQMNIVGAELPPISPGLDFYDTAAINIMQSLALDRDDASNNIVSNLIWGWSYIDTAHSSLAPSFKDYYIYACIVCDGAGYYNTAGLYTTNTETGNLYYDEIVTSANFPMTYDWLQKQSEKQGERPPLQSSIGLTLQGQAQATEMHLTPGVIYPSHCHQAEELYFALDPMGVSKTAGSDILKGYNGYTYDTSSYGTGPVNYSKLPIDFVADLSSQFPGNFMTAGNGDVIYNESLYYHAFNAGQRFQFTQWARLTWPQEGTYFPLNGGPQPPSGLECIAKPPQ